MLWGKYTPSKKPVRKHNVLLRPPPKEDKACITNEIGSDSWSYDVSRAMRLQSLGSLNWDEPLTFYGTKNEPDFDLFELAEIFPFTDTQWQACYAANKRELLLQCACVTETKVEGVRHDAEACYAYQVLSLNTLAKELRPILHQCIGVSENG